MLKLRNKKNKSKSYLTGIILFFSITVLLVLMSNKTQAAFSCDTGSLADGATCTVTSNKTLGAGENITGANATLVLSNNAQIIGALGSAATITVQNLTINIGSLLNFDGKGLTGGANGSPSGTNGNTSGLGGGGGGIYNNTNGFGGGGGGGGYGGVGGQGGSSGGGVGASGIENGQANLQQPTALGSGGGGGGNAIFDAGGIGGSGGGAVKIVVSGTFTNNGIVSSNGNVGSDDSGGRTAGGGGGASGGSIWIQAGTASGSGTIRANGGNGGAGYRAGGGGAGGRIAITGIDTAGFVKGSGFSMTPTVAFGAGANSGTNGSIYYNVSGTYTSVMDFSLARNFTSLTFNKTTTANSISTPSLTVDIRAGNTATPDGTWTSWLTNISSGTDINGPSYFNGIAYRYVQYRLNLASNNAIQSPKPYDKPTANPSLQDISFNYNAYLNKTLTSSIYNSNSDANLIGGISWDETLENNTNIKFQIQTSADGATNWSGFLGPDGTADTYFDEADSVYCTKNDPINTSRVTCTVDAIPTIFKNGTEDRYYQYKAFLQTTDGLATPTLNSVTVTYVVNANPEVEASQTTAVPDNNKKVNISYNVRDIDSETNTITPSFEYSLNGGSSWTAITSGCLEATDLDAKAVSAPDDPPEDTAYTSHTATWTPACESGISTTTYETDAQIRVRADDGQAANRYGYGTTENFTLDTKSPVISNLTLNASTDPAEISITSTDDSTYQMKLAQGTDLTDCQNNLPVDYEPYNATPTITPDQDPVTICVQLQDQYSNTSTISSTNSPETPTAFMVQDTTNTKTTPNEFRLFVAWKVSTDTDFNRYELWRSTDNSDFGTDPIFSTYTQSTNSYPDNTVVGDQLYYYKVKTIDTNNNQSFYSTTVQAKANGIQDFGEGGGGTSEAPPIISNVEIPPSPIFTSQATITWSTDVFSNSTVGYSTTPGSFTTEVGSDTMYDNDATGHYGPHTVILTNLTPDTDYYFQVKSMGTNQITGTDDNTDNNHLGYHFKTLPGPKIIQNSVSVSKTTNTTTTINWTTDIAASSKINYSTFSDMSNAENFLGTSQDSTNHEVTITGLAQGTKYYFYVQSIHNNDTATDNNQYPINSYYSFTTTQDLIAPEITFDPDTDISKTTTTAKINFTTSEQATSTLEYGETNSYGTTLTSDNLNINQVFDLEDLTPNTTYHFKITATDENSNPNNNSNTDYTFTTNSEETPDTTGPTISDIVVSDIKYDSAVISWVTDVVGNSLVDYGETNSYGEIHGGDYDNPVTVHEVMLKGLNSITTYYFKVISNDADNNKTENDNSGQGYTFTTTSPTSDSDQNGEGDQLSDIMSQIQDMIDNYYFTEAEIQDALSGLYSISITSSGPSVDITDTTATFTWTTNRPAIGKIYYWQDTDNQDTATSQAEAITAARSDHEIIIKNLNANSKYNFYAYSEGLLGTTTQSDNKSFSTGDTASLSGISISNLTLNSADISWTTTGSIDSSQLEYGETIKYGKSDKGKTSSNTHTVNLTNLKVNTTYHLRVNATDKDGQTLTSDDYSFTTTSLPVISNVTIKDIQIESATINWQTNVKTDSRVEFKKDNQDQGTTTGKLEAVTDHSFTLTNLFPGTRYSFKVSSKDAFNNESSSEELSFTTEEDLKAPQIT
ncbi:MAG: fibronectin type III domain-containing protein, partial [Parcubacteria group bacterium]